MRCPKCNKILVKRIGKDGEEKMICSDYPFCKYGAEEVHTYICDKCFRFDCVCDQEKITDNGVLKLETTRRE